MKPSSERQRVAAATDPDNRLLWRAPLRRFSAEQLRDSLWSVSGSLDGRIGGPPVWPRLPEEVMAVNPALLDDNAERTKGWYPSPESEQRVRAIYLVQKRTVRVPFMETFDLPENSVSCARRDVSLVAPQALTLLNNRLAIRAAEALADQVARETEVGFEELAELEQRSVLVRETFRRSLQRDPTAEELDACREFLEQRTLTELCRALMNTNEFGFTE
ncbi:MAG: DUF1553 domain-containing protein [Pirellulaceae bacterium]